MTQDTPQIAPAEKYLASLESLLMTILGAAQEWPFYHVETCPFCYEVQRPERPLAANHFADCIVLKVQDAIKGES